MELIESGMLISVFAACLRIATPLVLSAMGELITQRAGIWNLGIDGTMLTAAFAAYVVMITTRSLTLATLAGVVAGSIVGLLIAFMTATLRLNQFVTGLAINLVASGVTLFLFRSFTGASVAPGLKGFESIALPILSDIPYLGPVFFNQRGLTYVAFLLAPLVWLFLYKTRYGLELRALGENPKALETKGLPVIPRLYLATLAGSALTGLGGAFLVLGLSDRFIADISAGRGWLVVVALVAGNWNVWGTILAVVVFAFLDAIASHAQILALPVPYQVFLALPYLASIALLAVVRVRSGQPAQLGIPLKRP
ncbi:ABC transporter permease [Pseudomonas sp. Cab53]|uniref:ABC transporter permease n=1 Tax=Pseudomonas TaxID=286 RepID=UPI00190FF218|nr:MULTISPECIES: ABC transporter permease [Pseudomonas]BBH32629.1 putative ABC-type transport system, permease component [Pseudomonas sp. St290]BBP65771.1 ABC transporter permease [Pseudomonas sp. Cab53]GFM84554.1 ABC transporter permease [Pseudomonas cichorii]